MSDSAKYGVKGGWPPCWELLSDMITCYEQNKKDVAALSQYSVPANTTRDHVQGGSPISQTELAFFRIDGLRQLRNLKNAVHAVERAFASFNGERYGEEKIDLVGQMYMHDCRRTLNEVCAELFISVGTGSRWRKQVFQRVACSMCPKCHKFGTCDFTGVSFSKYMYEEDDKDPDLHNYAEAKEDA